MARLKRFVFKPVREEVILVKEYVYRLFRCGSGECIPDSAACNQKLDCLDGSDELQCRYRSVQAHTKGDKGKCHCPL